MTLHRRHFACFDRSSANRIGRPEAERGGLRFSVICALVASCNHRHDDPGSEREVGAGVGNKCSHCGMDSSGLRSEAKVAKKEGDPFPAAKMERVLRRVFLGYRVDTGIFLTHAIFALKNIH